MTEAKNALQSVQSNPFALDFAVEGALARAWSLCRPAVERMLGLTELGTLYGRACEETSVEGFLARSLVELGVEWNANALDLERIPRTGPCVVVANHPFGAVEGIVLGAMLRAVRPDVKILANYLLGRLEPMRELLVLVDPFGTANARLGNQRALREAVRLLQSGAMLAVFPAGEVAHWDVKAQSVVDPPWSETVAWLARAGRAPVLPVHFAGNNGPLFQLAGLVHARFRTALLPHELLNKRGRQIEVRVGAMISQRKLAGFSDDCERIAYLRKRTSMLAERPRAAGDAKGWQGAQQRRALAAIQKAEPLAAAVDPTLLAAEVDALPASQRLLEEPERVVVFARAEQIPWAMREIGRLRELTFRTVNEGTGKSRDLDRFDRTYLHLFTFDRRDRAIVGAYRLGPTDELLKAGAGALYTSTLFSMDPELFRRMGPALEMGRSFVCSQYQRSASGLFSLWRGIGKFLAGRPQYRVLFGPVSISNAYAQGSREVMVDFIKMGEHMHPFGRYVRPRHPFSPRRRTLIGSGLPPVRLFQDLEEVSEIVADIEPDQKGVPVLLKQYLKLGGKILGFNVDPQFSSVLDGLVLVDLLETDPKILARYFGAAEASEFLAVHRGAARRAAG
jgi:putative hemolysin